MILFICFLCVYLGTSGMDENKLLLKCITLAQERILNFDSVVKYQETFPDYFQSSFLRFNKKVYLDTDSSIFIIKSFVSKTNFSCVFFVADTNVILYEYGYEDNELFDINAINKILIEFRKRKIYITKKERDILLWDLVLPPQYYACRWKGISNDIFILPRYLFNDNLQEVTNNINRIRASKLFLSRKKTAFLLVGLLKRETIINANLKFRKRRLVWIDVYVNDEKIDNLFSLDPNDFIYGIEVKYKLPPQ
jgi:hypothetical protein